MSQDFLSSYKRRVNRLIGNSTAPQEMSQKNYPDNNFDLYQRKLLAQGMSTDPTTRDIKLQQESFFNALNNSFDSERVKIVVDSTGESGDEDYLSIIGNAATTWESDEKTIALDPAAADVGPGTTIDWIRTGFKYLLMYRDFDAKGYFSGSAEKANYLMKWSDDQGNFYKQWAVIKGPIEKDTDFLKNHQGRIDLDDGGNKFTMFMGKTPATKYLHRYDRLILKDESIGNTRAWIMDVIDDITNKYLLRITLEENFIDQIVDDYVEGVAYNFDQRSTLITSDLLTATVQDYVVTYSDHGFSQGQTIIISDNGGSLLSNDNKYYISVIDENTFNLSTILNGIPIKLTNNFDIETITYKPLINKYALNGYDYIKKGIEYEYDFDINTNENPALSNSYWQINFDSGLTIGSPGYGDETYPVPVVYVTLIDNRRIKLKVAPGAEIGNILFLTYDNGSDINITKTIKIVSPIS
jgi:hypothetical protein